MMEVWAAKGEFELAKCARLVAGTGRGPGGGAAGPPPGNERVLVDSKCIFIQFDFPFGADFAAKTKS